MIKVEVHVHFKNNTGMIYSISVCRVFNDIDVINALAKITDINTIESFKLED